MDDQWSATALSKEYYEQRACIPGTLIVSEATIIARDAAGCHNAPGIWSDFQIAAWSEITAAVHARGCAIYCQLWHQGRAAHANVLESQGFRLLSASAVPISPQDHVPEAMTEEEILKTIEDYAAAAKNAIAAGFDGVEIHGANGYLPDQFLQTTCNKRVDNWGGAVSKIEQGFTLNPYSDFNGMLMDQPEPTFEYLLARLKPLNLSYLHLIEARIKGNDDADCGGQKSVAWMVKLWDNVSPVVFAGGFKPQIANSTVDLNNTYRQQRWHSTVHFQSNQIKFPALASSATPDL
ncbi:hypothetical protein EKO04_004041 [Ascochyta lentis]|uniref:NADH:flavin oxidoreductase/NADH oxidase N-terminal domain-containing protein n=1 Tax=Ascochyta lentis TaxID=205686 RepID=A0A8H7J4D3_9PLEO|nr:hypothetical protein EKO04_004041 [Ascochyta lentis]